jgi:hypothetical protein
LSASLHDPCFNRCAPLAMLPYGKLPFRSTCPHFHRALSTHVIKTYYHMKIKFQLICLTLFSGASCGPLMAQDSRPAVERAPEPIPAITSRRVLPLHDGTGRNLILERVDPPVLPVLKPAAAPLPVDPAVWAARRATRATEAKKERRILSLTGIYYPNGQTLLQWFTPGPDGRMGNLRGMELD